MTTLISEKDTEKTKKQIKIAKKPIIVVAQNNDYNRKMLEYGKFDILLSPELVAIKDKPKQLDSGLNSIMGRIASKNKIAIGINLKDIKQLNKKEKALRLARIKQNIKICRKTNTKIKILNSTNKSSVRALLLSLGADTKQTKTAISETISF